MAEARAAGAVRTAVSVYVLPRARGALCTRRTTPRPRPRPRGPAGPAQADSLRPGDWGSVSVRKRGSPAVALATLPDHFLHVCVCVARAMLGTRRPRPPGLLCAFCVDSPRPRGGRAVGPGHGRRLRASEPPGKRRQCDLLPRTRRGRSGACGHQQGGCPALGSARSVGRGAGWACCPRQPWALPKPCTSWSDLHRVPCRPRHVSSPSLRGSMTTAL